MSRLWEKGLALDQVVHRFTVGSDPQMDLRLLPYDCLGSLAHAIMLMSIDLLSVEELQSVQAGLKQILGAHEAGQVAIDPADEDGHTWIEKSLTASVGEAGKKIHTGRSRNDQVIVTLRLFAREALLHLAEQISNLAQTLLERAAEGYEVPMPGYTHMRQAMPSSFGHLFSAYAESLIQDLELLEGALRFVNRSPLGSASGYGVPLPLDRPMVSDLLGFDHPDCNALYIQNTRGKMESIVLSSLLQVQMDLGRLAHDLILFSMSHFGFVKIPEAFTTGSSIMPQKRNPDALELVRGQVAAIQARFNEVVSTIAHLPAGYQRDVQLTKEPFLTAIERVSDSVVVMDKICAGLELQPEACRAGFVPEIFATDYALDLVAQGLPFREAYQRAAQELQAGASVDLDTVMARREHLGSPSDNDLSPLEDLLAFRNEAFAEYRDGVDFAWSLFDKELPDEVLIPFDEEETCGPDCEHEHEHGH